jgi:hypothetical protein
MQHNLWAQKGEALDPRSTQADSAPACRIHLEGILPLPKQGEQVKFAKSLNFRPISTIQD